MSLLATKPIRKSKTQNEHTRRKTLSESVNDDAIDDENVNRKQRPIDEGEVITKKSVKKRKMSKPPCSYICYDLFKEFEYYAKF